MPTMMRVSLLLLAALPLLHPLYAQESATPPTTATVAKADDDTAKAFYSAALAYWRAAAKVRAFVFDEATYAIPEKAKTGWIPGVDKQPGQETAESLFTDALVAYAAMLKTLSPDTPVKTKTPDTSPEWMASIPRYTLPLLPTDAAQFPPAPTGNATAKTIRAYLSLCIAVQQENITAAKDWSPVEQSALQTVNLLRIVTGVPPMSAHAQCYAAAAEHSRWQQAHETLTHTRPESSKRSFVDRLKAAGYTRPGGECLGGMPLADAVWAWRADAGHHRILLHPEWRACGIAGAGEYCTLDAGRASTTPQRDEQFTTLLQVTP